MAFVRLSEWWRAAIASRFAGATGLLVGGTALGQLVTIALLPLLTRLYSPAEFTLLAIYAATLTIISVAACARLDIAIPLPESDEDAACLLVLSLIACTAISLLSAAALLAWDTEIARLLGSAELRPYLWMFPVGIWLAGNCSAFLNWATRRKQFGTIARTRISQAIIGTTVQVVLGILGSGPFGLLLGYMLVAGSGWFVFAYDALRRDAHIFRGVTTRRLRSTLGKYRQLPQFSVAESLANTAGIQLPVILIAGLVSGPEAGFLFLAMRAVGAPVTLIGTAIAQVFLSSAPEADRGGRLAGLTRNMLVVLGRIGLVGLVLGAIFAPPLFAFVFGDEWHRAGILIVWALPWFFLKLLISPVSMVMHVKMMQKTMLALTIAGLSLRVGAVFLAAYGIGTGVSESFCVASALYYLLLLVVISRIAGVRLGEAAKAMFRFSRA